MLYYLLTGLTDEFWVLNMFRYLADGPAGRS